MANWKNAPLIYTLGMMQFPRVPNIDRFADAFFDKIRSEYPLSQVEVLPILSGSMSAEGFQFTQSESKMWQYLSVDRAWGFVLNEQSICLHSIRYHDFADFAKRFKTGVLALLGVPEIGIEWVTAIGIRYVDMIVPDGHRLEDFLQTWILPAEPPESPMKILEGNYIARYKTEIGELRLQSMRSPPFTLPPELQTPLIAKNLWAKERPNTDFAIIDTDHGITYSDPVAVNIDNVILSLDKLHLMSKLVFESMGKPLAVTTWKGES